MFVDAVYVKIIYSTYMYIYMALILCMVVVVVRYVYFQNSYLLKILVL